MVGKVFLHVLCSLSLSSLLLTFIQTWLDEYSEDFRDPPLHPALCLLLDHLRISSAVHGGMRSQPNFCSLAGQAEELLRKFQKDEGDPLFYNFSFGHDDTVGLLDSNCGRKHIKFPLLTAFFPPFFKFQEHCRMLLLVLIKGRKSMPVRIQDVKPLWIRAASWISPPHPSLSSSLKWTLCVTGYVSCLFIKCCLYLAI